MRIYEARIYGKQSWKVRTYMLRTCSLQTCSGRRWSEQTCSAQTRPDGVIISGGMIQKDSVMKEWLYKTFPKVRRNKHNDSRHLQQIAFCAHRHAFDAVTVGISKLDCIFTACVACRILRRAEKGHSLYQMSLLQRHLACYIARLRRSPQGRHLKLPVSSYDVVYYAMRKFIHIRSRWLSSERRPSPIAIMMQQSCGDARAPPIYVTS